MNPHALIEIKDLHVHFQGEKSFHALKGINITLYPGQVTALIGTSGSGKSVTSMALMGLLPPKTEIRGEILYNGNIDLLKLSEQEWPLYRGSKISMIFQEPMSALNPLMTCGDQILEAYYQHHPQASLTEAKLKVIEWLEKVQIPQPKQTYDKYPHQISGGQKQRVVIAMAMINEPELILADEPTTALDVIVQKEIIDLLRSLQLSTQASVLFITHDLLLAQTFADQIIQMKNGVIVERDLEAIPLVSTEVEYTPSRTLIDVQNVCIHYEHEGMKVTAVDHVNVNIPEGKTIGLIGGSGCGKTTLSKSILGLIPVASGKILYQDVSLNSLNARQWKKYRKDIQIIFQDPYAALNPRIKIGDALDEVLLVHTNLSPIDRRNKVMDMLQKVELKETDFYKYPHEFSGGQRQRICIARALILEPKFVICDESVAALDIVIQKQILDLLKKLQNDLQLTYLFITHDINVVINICDYVYVMEKGKIVEEGVTSQIINHAQHPYTQLLIDAVPR